MKTPIFHVPTANASPLRLPLVGQHIKAGFPSPADDYVEDSLDLNELLIRHKAATFFCRVNGTSMEAAKIFDGDLLIVDRSINPSSGSIVVAAIDGEFVVKRLVKDNNQLRLEAASPDYEPMILKEGQELAIWGVVTGSVRLFR